MAVADAGEVTLTVHDDARATFRGLGVNQPERWNRIDDIPRERRQELAGMMAAMGMKVLRIWADGIDSTTDLTLAKQYFEEGYIDNHFLQDYLDYGGHPLVVLSPWHWDNALNKRTVPDDVQAYASRVAELIAWVMSEHGIAIHATGVVNEPGSWPHDKVRDAVKYLREELDARGLTNVGVIAPEYSGAKPKAMECIEVLEADPDAWAAVSAISTHSYHALAQIGAGLRPGATTRYVTTSLEQEADRPDMTYSYGRKPALGAAAARNSDGSWFLAVVNDTDIPDVHYDVVGGSSSWYPAATYDVEFVVHELAAAGTMRFEVWRSGRGQPVPTRQGIATMVDGRVTVSGVAPWDLVTLVSAPTIESRPNPPTGLRVD